MRNKLIYSHFHWPVFWPGRVAAYFFSLTKPPLAPVFDPASDPYASGIYAEGIVESVQASGENINIYPEVRRHG